MLAFHIPELFFPCSAAHSHSPRGRVPRMVLKQLEGAWSWLLWVSLHLLAFGSLVLAFSGSCLPAQLLFSAPFSNSPVPGVAPHPSAPRAEPPELLHGLIPPSIPHPSPLGAWRSWRALPPSPRVEGRLGEGNCSAGSRGDTCLSHPLASQSSFLAELFPSVRGWGREIPLQAGSPWPRGEPGTSRELWRRALQMFSIPP